MNVLKYRAPSALDRAVYLFPGQGAYLESVFVELAGQRPELGDVFGQIDVAVREAGLRGPVSPLLFGQRPPSMETLLHNDPDLLQLALYGTSVALGRILVDEAGKPSVLMGHSLGEVAALTVSGAFSVRDGALLVARRSAALRSAAGPGGMLALAAGTRRVSALVELLGDPEVVVAVENSPRQTVVSGPWERLQLISEVAGRLGIGATRLRSPYPFHNALLAEAVEVFYRSIRGIRQSPLRIPVYSPVSGRYYSDGDDLAAMLASHFTRPVHFLDALRHVHGTGADVFVECGARDALTGVVAGSLPAVTTIPCLTGPSTVDSLNAALSRMVGGEAEWRVVRPDAARLEPGSSESGAAETGTGEAGTAEAEAAEAGTGGPASPMAVSTAGDSGPVSTTSVPTACTPTDSVPTASGSPALDRAAVVADLCGLYAYAVEYPVEVFAEGVDLEADLGVDSVKQTELLSRVAVRYGLPGLSEGFRVADYPTLGRIADLVIKHGSAGQGVTPQQPTEQQPNPQQPTQLSSEQWDTTEQPASAPGSGSPVLDRAAVVEDLCGLYAYAVEYPVEVFAEGVDLEADLGVDSVKQTELLSRVAVRYGLPGLSEGFRVADYPTLGRIADLVIAHGSLRPAVA